MPLSRRSLALLVTALTALLLVAGPAMAAGDDYPYRSDTTHSVDRWGFTRGQCVSFVAWRLAQHRTTLRNAPQRWGDASGWDETAARLGYRSGSRPVVGAVAQWNADERSPLLTGSRVSGAVVAGGYGHVGYVRAVFPDGSASVEGYNLLAPGRYGVVRLRAPRYLYVGVRPPALHG